MRAFLLSFLLWTTAQAGTNEVGTKFLEENKDREGVVTLSSGLQYKVLKKGKGKFSPKVGTTCSCHYAGTTPSLTENAIDIDEKDWKEFDSSYKRGTPTEFAPNQVIKGWTEAMQLMVEGDKWEMYIPSDLGYGDGGSGEKIKGGDVLIFRMEILEIKGKGKRRVKCDFSKASEGEEASGCDAQETKFWNEWSGKGLVAVQEKVKALEEQTSEALKKGEREPLMESLKLLKSISKAMKKAEL